jgi:hypothetical protein
VAAWLVFLLIPNVLAAVTTSYTYCPYGVVGYCGQGVILDGVPYYKFWDPFPVSPLVGFTVEVGILGALTGLVMHSISKYDCWCYDTEVYPSRRKCRFITIAIYAWLTFVVVMIPISINVGFFAITTQFWNTTQSFSECRQYLEYSPFVLGDWIHRHGYGQDDFNVRICDKFRGLGFAKGVVYDSSLPGTM